MLAPFNHPHIVHALVMELSTRSRQPFKHPDAVSRDGRFLMNDLSVEEAVPPPPAFAFAQSIVNVRDFWETGARSKTEGQILVVTATIPIPSIPVR
jgi:hypothetical protein